MVTHTGSRKKHVSVSTLLVLVLSRNTDRYRHGFWTRTSRKKWMTVENKMQLVVSTSFLVAYTCSFLSSDDFKKHQHERYCKSRTGAGCHWSNLPLFGKQGCFPSVQDVSSPREESEKVGQMGSRYRCYWWVENCARRWTDASVFELIIRIF